MRGWLKNTFDSLTKKQTFPLRTILSVFFVAILGLGFFLAPELTFAAWWNPADWLWDFEAALLKMGATAIYYLGFIFVKVGIFFTTYLVESSAVTENWKKIRDLSLGLFGLTIIAIALMNILKIKIDEWGVNRMIPRLALAAVAVLFSKYVCITILNFSNAAANAITTELHFNIYEPFDMLGSVFGDYCTGCAGQVNFISALMLFIVAIWAFLFLLILGFVLILRGLFLAFLIVVSPLAFALNVVPWTTEGFKKWWGMFIKWTFFYPICLLILAVGITISTGAQQTGYLPLKELIAGTLDIGIFDADDAIEQVSKLFAQFSFSLIALVTIPVAIFVPLKLLGSAGAMIGGAMRKAGKYGGGMATGKHHIPGLKKDPKSYRDTYKKYFDESAKRKMNRTGGAVRTSFTTGRLSNNRLAKRFGAPSMARNMDKVALAERSKEISNLRLDKKMEGFYLQRSAALANGDNVKAAEFDSKIQEHIGKPENQHKRAQLEAQHQALEDFSQLYGHEDTALALAGDAGSKGWLDNKALTDTNVKSVADARGFNLVGDPKQAEKRIDLTGKTLDSCSAADLGKTNTDAITSKEGYSDNVWKETFDGDAGRQKAIDMANAQTNVMSAGKKREIAERLEGIFGADHEVVQIMKDAADGNTPAQKAAAAAAQGSAQSSGQTQAQGGGTQQATATKPPEIIVPSAGQGNREHPHSEDVPPPW